MGKFCWAGHFASSRFLLGIYGKLASVVGPLNLSGTSLQGLFVDALGGVWKTMDFPSLVKEASESIIFISPFRSSRLTAAENWLVEISDLRNKVNN